MNIDQLAFDVKYAARRLRQSPGFTAVAVLTLALGIGVNVAVFTVFNAVLLNPSGVKSPEQVVVPQTHYKMGNTDLSAPSFADVLNSKEVFASAAIKLTDNYNWNNDGAGPERLVAAQVSWQWFDVFQAHPEMGRTFKAEEDKP